MSESAITIGPYTIQDELGSGGSVIVAGSEKLEKLLLLIIGHFSKNGDTQSSCRIGSELWRRALQSGSNLV